MNMAPVVISSSTPKEETDCLVKENAYKDVNQGYKSDLEKRPPSHVKQTVKKDEKITKGDALSLLKGISG